MIHLYRLGEDDMLLVACWNEMVKTGDLDKVWYDPPTLGACLTHFVSGENILMLCLDEDGCWAAFWFEPFAAGAFFNAWIHPRKRGTKEGIGAMIKVSEIGLQSFNILMAATKQERTYGLALKLGCAKLVEVPGLFGSDPAFFVLMTRESLEKVKEKHYGQR